MRRIFVSGIGVLLAALLFVERATPYPVYLRLKFDSDPDTEGYLWERNIVHHDSCWAEQSYDAKSWEPLPGLPRRIKVGLSLGGGGVCGLVHIGVLRAFEENNIPFHGIAGTSMGAIIGGLYACGYSVDKIEEIVDSIDWNSIFAERPPRKQLPIWEILREKPREPGMFFNLVWDWRRTPPANLIPFIKIDPRGGLREGQTFIDEIAKYSLKPVYQAGFDFDSLEIPYGAILTNLNREQVSFKRKGTIATVARASGSIPIAFEPLNLADSQFVDGGVLDDLPVDVFIPFDTLRAPKNNMRYIGEDKVRYVIAVSPYQRRGVRDEKKEKQNTYPFVGLKVKAEAADFSREIYVWQNWNKADGKIDADATGFLEFNDQVVKQMIKRGYNAAWKEIYHIKKDLALLEDSARVFGSDAGVDSLRVIKGIRRVSTITIYTLMADQHFILGPLVFLLRIGTGEPMFAFDENSHTLILSEEGVRINNDTCYVTFGLCESHEVGMPQDELLAAMMDCIVGTIESSKSNYTLEDIEEETLETYLREYTEKYMKQIGGGKEKNRLLKAIQYIEGSHLQKEDICDALERLYNLGDFEDVLAKIEGNEENWDITFLVKPKREYSAPITVRVELEPATAGDAACVDEVTEIIRLSIQDTIIAKKRALNFNETERMVKSFFVDHGFIRPKVFSSKMENDTLTITGRAGNKLDGIRLRGEFSQASRIKLRGEFSKPFNPGDMLDGTKYVLKEYELRYAYIEGIQGDSLVVAAAKKPNTTLEYPSLALEGFEGINSFGELRVRRWHVMNLFTTSPYVRYSFNYVMKDAEELPRGQRVGAGLEKCSNRLVDFPEIRGYWRNLKYPAVPGSHNYDMEIQENNGKITYPFYAGNWAIIPGFEISKFKENGEWSEIYREATVALKYDILDRAVFPESGLKIDIDTKFGLEPQRWSRARMRLLWIPMNVKLQQKVTTTLSLRLFYSKLFENPPQHERYSLGGFSPIGSYCLRVYDAEDLPGYRKDEFLEREMWKGLITWRFGLMEIAPMGLRFNIQMESFMYLAGVGEHASIKTRLEECPGFGLYFDTSYFNVGLIALFHKETYRQGEDTSLEHLINHFYFSTSYYGFAL